MSYTSIRTNRVYAKSLKDKLEGLGILGIKLGQYICNRVDLCTPLMKKELSVLLHMNKIHSMEHTKSLLANDEIIIGDIIGSGSMTQVYHCKIKDEPLVLKIKHPETLQLHNEIRVVRNILYTLSYFPWFRMFANFDWDEFFDVITKQLDMTNEARFMKRFHSFYDGKLDTITIPRFIDGNKDWIIMTYCPGKPMYLLHKDDPCYKKAHNLMTSSYIHTLFMHGIVHGDIHEGNILVQDNGNLSLIDFGICIEITEEELIGLYAICKYEEEPSVEYARDMVETMIHPYTLYHKPIVSEQLAHVLHEKFKTNIGITVSEFLEFITTKANGYQVVLRGHMISFFLTIILIESLSPYSEVQQLSNVIATSYMAKDPFFRKEGGDKILNYHKLLYKKTHVDLIEKYNITKLD
jgi:predicted unusual protein kinase regulating ubiquinone biosynthesis (AarF/ABC1/UbiB family)